MLAAHNPTGCPATLTTANATHWAQYNTANEVSKSDTMPGGLVYEGAGNVTNDGTNHYVYDPEGRICAVWTPGPVYTQYVYDAEGTRVAKGTIAGAALSAAFPPPPQPGAATPTPYCAAPTAANGFTLTASYLRGAAGQQDVELWAASGAWRQNVRGPDGLFASYNFANSGATPLSLSFVFNDWLGTKRLEVNASGQLVNWWSSDPFGNYQTPHNSTADPSDQHFTGKERDTESGNDYFGARYYSSNMGRFSSPDPLGNAVADPADPQSWNMYAYARNNPLSNIDPDGYDCVYLNSSGDGIDKDGIDRNSNSGECGDHGGYWVDGNFTSGTVYSNSNDVYLRGYDASGLTDSYTTVVTPSGGSSPVDVFSGPNLFASIPSQALPPDQLNSIIHAVNFSGQPDSLIGCLVAHESRGIPGATTPDGKAVGLMQVRRQSANDDASRRGGPFGGMTGSQIFSQLKDPAVAVAAGSSVLAGHISDTHGVHSGIAAQFGSNDPAANSAFADQMQKGMTDPSVCAHNR